MCTAKTWGHGGRPDAEDVSQKALKREEVLLFSGCFFFFPFAAYDIVFTHLMVRPLGLKKLSHLNVPSQSNKVMQRVLMYGPIRWKSDGKMMRCDTRV